MSLEKMDELNLPVVYALVSSTSRLESTHGSRRTVSCEIGRYLKNKQIQLLLLRRPRSVLGMPIPWKGQARHETHLVARCISLNRRELRKRHIVGRVGGPLTGTGSTGA